MLLQFSVSNFRSFKDEQFITMIPAKVKGHEENIAHPEPGLDVLRSAVIYGANASGKSNFIKAMLALNYMIKHSAEKKPGDKLLFEPFLLNPDTLREPTEFKLDFLIDAIRYHYEIKFSRNEVLHEKLTFFPNHREAKLFERRHQAFSFGELFKGSKKLLSDITSPNQLLLSKGATMNNAVDIVKVFSFFEKISSTLTITGVSVEPALRQFYAEQLKSNGTSFARNLFRLFSVFDTGIKSFRIEISDTPETIDFSNHFDDGSVEANLGFKIKTIHHLVLPEGIADVPFDLKDESAGSQKLFVISGLVIQALEEGSILLLDEIERSLHPHISRFIVSLFNNPKINKNNAQLIAATHDVTLLSEENKLRRDQIWIVEKNEQGASQLFSLADMKGIRDNVPFEKWYLSGRFGGVPNIESLQFEFDYLDEKKENHTNGKKD